MEMRRAFDSYCDLPVSLLSLSHDLMLRTSLWDDSLHLTLYSSSTMILTDPPSLTDSGRLTERDVNETDPHFTSPILNVTIAVGRDAQLPCTVDNLGSFKVLYDPGIYITSSFP